MNAERGAATVGDRSRHAALRELARFIVVGVINTAFGYGIFWLGLRLLALSAPFANTLSYAISLCLSFVLTRRFVFRASEEPARQSAWRFLLAFAIAFAVNQAVLWLLLQLVWRTEIAQLFAMASYTIVFFALNKFFVFQRAPAAP